MRPEHLRERVKLYVARSLDLSDNEHDAVVLVDSLMRSGIIDVTIPEQSIMKSLSGEEFVELFALAMAERVNEAINEMAGSR
jgi:hypothetical protein